jgi:Asp-tRNA(Asn)/Glu-tRNA(Gln) amidotransferase A subunit family amidase
LVYRLIAHKETTAFNLGDEIDDPLTMYANDLLTTPVNLAGLPGKNFIKVILD